MRRVDLRRIVLLVVPVFFFLAQLPTLTIILYTAPAYDVTTLRLHLSKGEPEPEPEPLLTYLVARLYKYRRHSIRLLHKHTLAFM